MNLSILSKSEVWFIDGTFNTCPTLFEQLYTIHVKNFNYIIPVVYALLSNKTEVTCRTFIDELQRLQPGLNPRFVMVDFELAAIQASKEGFHNINVTGCFFHLCQSVWRKVQAEGLKLLYESDNGFARWVKMIPALAFVPVEDILHAFSILIEAEDFPAQAMPIADYFESTYIGRPGRHRAARFPPELWNVFERTIQNVKRTNNNVEGWHRGFQSACGGLYPNFFKFLNILKSQQHLHQYEIAQILSGHSISRKNDKYAAISLRLQQLVQRYNRDNVIEHLRGVTYNFEF